MKCDSHFIWETLLVLFAFILLGKDKEISPILCIFAFRLNEKVKNIQPNLIIENVPV